MGYLVETLRMLLFVALVVPFGFSVWPVLQSSSFYDKAAPQEQSCVARGTNRYRC
jgi:hypothetical protein